MINEHRKFSFKDLDLQKNDLLPMFGNQDNDILAQSDWEKILIDLESLNEIQGGYYIYDKIHYNTKEKIIEIGGLQFNIGPVLFPRFKNVDKIAVTICTASATLDNLSKNYINQGEYLIGYSIDALGAIIVEKVLEIIMNNLRNAMKSIGYSITGCYSPGYCEWPLSEQKKIFKLLPDRFCNVFLSDSCLMLPLKSVSGLIGIGVKVQEEMTQCRICTMANCYMRKEDYSY